MPQKPELSLVLILKAVFCENILCGECPNGYVQEQSTKALLGPILGYFCVQFCPILLGLILYPWYVPETIIAEVLQLGSTKMPPPVLIWNLGTLFEFSEKLLQKKCQFIHEKNMDTFISKKWPHILETGWNYFWVVSSVCSSWITY